MKEKLILEHIKENIINSINEPWDSAVLNIQVAKNFSSYKGHYISEEIKKSLKVSRFDQSIDDELIELHRILILERGEKDWNQAEFKLTNDGNYTIEYIWNQELYDTTYCKP